MLHQGVHAASFLGQGLDDVTLSDAAHKVLTIVNGELRNAVPLHGDHGVHQGLLGLNSQQGEVIVAAYRLG